MNTGPLSIIFMGTPEFAVASLDLLFRNGYHIAAVVTVPDKPAGRGLELQPSDVKKYAVQKGLRVLQPEKLKDPSFLAELESIDADLQIVVAFRMLPEAVWKMPRLGTFNLHGSLLPQYRGAAPINRAVMNGEKITGITTFFLQHEIDTGKIIFRQEIPIGDNETAGELHDKMKEAGAELVLRTVKAIEQNNYPQIPQEELVAPGETLHTAPKIFREDCRIYWDRTAKEVHDLVRGLSPYPAAFTEFPLSDGKTAQVKIFRTEKQLVPHQERPGTLLTDGKSVLKVAVKDGYILITELQQAGKKRMSVDEFLRGFRPGPTMLLK